MKCIQESSEVSQGYSSSECCRFVGGVMKQSIECQLYLWILKSYQRGTRIGSERDSRSKHITAWTKNVAEKFCMCLHLSVCVRLRQRASAHRKLNVWTRLDGKNFCSQISLLFKDFQDVLYSWPRTVGANKKFTFRFHSTVVLRCEPFRSVFTESPVFAKVRLLIQQLLAFACNG